MSQELPNLLARARDGDLCAVCFEQEGVVEVMTELHLGTYETGILYRRKRNIIDLSGFV